MESVIFIVVRGSSYVTIALGFALVFGAGRVLNLSHGAFFLLAAYLTYWLAGWDVLGGSVLLAVVLAVVITAVVGGLIFHSLLRPTADRPNRTMVLCLAINFVLAEALRAFFGTRGVLVPTLLEGAVRVGGVTVPWQQVLVVLAGAALLLATALVLRRTRLGRAVRAVAQDREAAEVLGIEAAPVLAGTFAVSAGLAGLAACLIAPLGFVSPWGWISPLIKSFAVVVLGGTRLRGVLMAAFLLSTAEILAGQWIAEGAAEYVSLVVILTVLILRPQGIVRELR